jgi:hypothetical protein
MNWTPEVFEITRIRDSLPPVYYLRDLTAKKEDLTGGFYERYTSLICKDYKSINFSASTL